MANIAPAERSSAPLAGKYTRHGGKLTGTTTLLLVHRSATTSAKASTYLLRVDDHGKRHYVSSLWDGPTPGTYALESGGIRYFLTLTDDTASIVPAVRLSTPNVHVHQ
jgi:hypothetical protein